MNSRMWILSLPLIAGACAGSHAEQVRDARMERVDEQTKVQNEMVEERGDQRKKALDQQYQAREDGVNAQNAPGSEESAKLLELSKERSDYQAEKRTQLDKIAVRINAAQQKISVLGDRAPTKLRTALQSSLTEHHSLQQELSGLSQVRSTGWENEKKRLDERVSSLEDRVGQLSDDIDDTSS